MCRMKHILNYLICNLFFLFSSSGIFAGTHIFEYTDADSTLVSADGPYVLYKENGSARII